VREDILDKWNNMDGRHEHDKEIVNGLKIHHWEQKRDKI
jgi:hypothetical protein